MKLMPHSLRNWNALSHVSTCLNIIYVGKFFGTSPCTTSLLSTEGLMKIWMLTTQFYLRKNLRTILTTLRRPTKAC